MMRNPLPPEVSSRLTKIRPAGAGYSALCPAHEDSTPSLSLTVDHDGKLLAFCHAGCSQDLVLDAIGATPQILDPQWAEREAKKGEWTPNGEAVAVYDYTDADGKLLFQVLRTADKKFTQRRPDVTAKSGWKWALGDVDRPLYRLPKVLAAVEQGQPVWVAEGEKDVHSLEAAGLVATCNPGGAGKWRPHYAETFRDAEVTVVADKDGPGQSHARLILADLEPVTSSVRIVEAADPHKDAAAHLGAGLGVAAFLETARPGQTAALDLAPGIHEFLAMPDREFDWVIPGLLERGERLMITGFEGWGKSSLIRMLALAMASGIHPFTLERQEPSRVLYVDCENSERQTRRAMRWILPVCTDVYGATVDNDHLRLIVRPEGLDLGRDEDASWLLERVTAHRPDALFIGPLYRLHADNGNDEQVARKVAAALDAPRVRMRCAVVIEAHSGHGGVAHRRPIRPLGSSFWQRWVEHGVGLRECNETDMKRYSPLEVSTWKPGRDRREWPQMLMHGYSDRGRLTEWPWVPTEPDPRRQASA